MRCLTTQSKVIASLLSLFFFPALTVAQNVQLSWDASTSKGIIGYNVYRGPNSGGPYTQINPSLDPNLTYTDNNVQPGQTYYYVTTAVNSDYSQSGYSNQTEAVIPTGGSGSESALYNFAGGNDPKLPYAGLIFDKAGNLYGTSELGGSNNQGTVFEITPNANGTWTETILYNFTGSTDGGQPNANLVFDNAGHLYGTTNYGGSTNCNLGCGTVFKLTPGSNGWNETTIHTFTGGSDGREPNARVLLDATGNLYGTTMYGGNIGSVCSMGCGTVFKLTKGSNGWTQSVLYAFTGGTDGASPYDGLVFDPTGNLYGTTYSGGSGNGTVFELTPGSSGWTESVIHAFNGAYDGKGPYGDLILDATGNLYGTTFEGGLGFGIVFQIRHNPAGGWRERLLHAFFNTPAGNPVAGLVMDTAGNLYGTTMLGATQTGCNGGCGTLFKLVPGSGGPWTYKVIHDFGKSGDGFHPTGDLILDSAGNMYGTTQAGGTQGSGMIFEIQH